MIQYVVGLLFDDLGEWVVLIRKNRPIWQTGRLNGVGGHIEPGESSMQAVYREFVEETGVVTNTHSWTHNVHLVGNAFSIDFYSMRNTVYTYDVKTMTDEVIEVRHVPSLTHNYDLLPNLRWIIPFSLDPCAQLPVVVQDAPALYDTAYSEGRIHV